MADLKQQARELEAFIETKLGPRLEEVQMWQLDAAEEMQGYAQLESEVMALRSGAGPKQVLEDIGCGIKVQAEYTEPEEVYVHVGLGFHAPLLPDMCAPLAEARCAILQGRLEGLERDRLVVLQDIADAEELLRQVSSIDPEQS